MLYIIAEIIAQVSQGPSYNSIQSQSQPWLHFCKKKLPTISYKNRTDHQQQNWTDDQLLLLVIGPNSVPHKSGPITGSNADSDSHGRSCTEAMELSMKRKACRDCSVTESLAGDPTECHEMCLQPYICQAESDNITQN